MARLSPAAAWRRRLRWRRYSSDSPGKRIPGSMSVIYLPALVVLKRCADGQAPAVTLQLVEQRCGCRCAHEARWGVRRSSAELDWPQCRSRSRGLEMVRLVWSWRTLNDTVER